MYASARLPMEAAREVVAGHSARLDTPFTLQGATAGNTVECYGMVESGSCRNEGVHPYCMPLSEEANMDSRVGRATHARHDPVSPLFQ